MVVNILYEYDTVETFISGLEKISVSNLTACNLLILKPVKTIPAG
jgi:hypothetical protein